jgi:hypothetical protein
VKLSWCAKLGLQEEVVHESKEHGLHYWQFQNGTEEMILKGVWKETVGGRESVYIHDCIAAWYRINSHHPTCDVLRPLFSSLLPFTSNMIMNWLYF